MRTTEHVHVIAFLCPSTHTHFCNLRTLQIILSKLITRTSFSSITKIKPQSWNGRRTFRMRSGLSSAKQILENQFCRARHERFEGVRLYLSQTRELRRRPSPFELIRTQERRKGVLKGNKQTRQRNLRCVPLVREQSFHEHANEMTGNMYSGSVSP